MEILVSRFAAVVLAATCMPASVLAQATALATDAEHHGASIAAGQVEFHNVGTFSKGILKTDYVRNGLTYKTGTLIEFFTDGRVAAGTLAAGTALPGRENIVLVPGFIRFHANGGIQSAPLKAGSRDLNVVLPVDMNVGFTPDGLFTTMSPISNAFLTYFFDNRTLRNGGAVEFAYDRQQGRYFMTRGTVGASQIVSSLVTARSALGIPTTVVPVVVPPVSTFTLSSRNPIYSDNPQYDYWYYEGTFTINGYNFGSRPRLYIKESRLFAVQISQALTIDGVQYPSNAVISLNDVGKIIK